ncbi:MAG: hypothetical protein KKB62_01545 [Nanoarchaeota archaeon]|nr:hypothetical protein [Nanoarchaeota archaeon]
MLNKLLNEVVLSIVGKSAEEIVEPLNSNKHVNEFILAKKLEITINQTRNILYKIADYGLVSSIRKKDKKKGWYTYYWKFEILKCLEYLKELWTKEKEKIQSEVELRKSKMFYVCESCDLEYDEDQALLMDFTCDECGKIFSVKNNSKMIKDYEKVLLKIEDKLKIVGSEIEKEHAKLGKKRGAELKKEEKEKEMKKAENRRKRKAEKEAKKKTEKKVQKISEKKSKKTKKISKKKPSKGKTKSKKKPVQKKVKAKKSSHKKVVKKKTKRKK